MVKPVFIYIFIYEWNTFYVTGNYFPYFNVVDITDDDGPPPNKSKKPNIAEIFRQKYPETSAQHKNLTRLVTTWLAADGKSIYTVESQHFCDMLAGFDNR